MSEPILDPTTVLPVDTAADGATAGLVTEEETVVMPALPVPPEQTAHDGTMTGIVAAAALDAYKAGDAAKHATLTAFHLKLAELRTAVLAMDSEEISLVNDVANHLRKCL